MPSLRNIPQPGLFWEYASNSPHKQPMWTTEPCIDTIRNLAIEHLGIDGECKVTPMEEKRDDIRSKKLFRIECERGSFIFKAMLPLAPQSKTLSEVATLSFVQGKTSIPVPKVIAYDANLNNSLGFEWVLLGGVDNFHRRLDDSWRELSRLQKHQLIGQIADYVVQLMQVELSGIGSVFRYNLRSHSSEAPEDFTYVTGEVVSPEFFRENRIQLALHRGPYQTSSEYIAAHMEFLMHENAAMRTSSNAAVQAQATRTLRIAHKINMVVEKLFPSFDAEPTFIKPNLDKCNIYIDASDSLAGILDRSSVTAVPLWAFCDTPCFLDGAALNPYLELVIELLLPVEERRQVERVEEHENEQLRSLFVQQMRELAPKWAASYEKDNLERDVLVAVDYADEGMYGRRVMGWLNCVLEGRVPRRGLAAAISNPFPRNQEDTEAYQRGEELVEAADVE
ncbi:hypothetical protein C7974DRAFT_443407 [Boeremia exigua]|uniref:uncharacterized protein n=1 Tax=Boeremia exigua TaxID=749465 RepID=UPI001E8D0DBA|nr:uncharacterized protein C7974DRAFT_443407 [Boeremia exigua]KAH6615250.1 hypothetical protein C7974DRAFT_443407 [Boeremia exigua]